MTQYEDLVRRLQENPVDPQDTDSVRDAIDQWYEMAQLAGIENVMPAYQFLGWTSDQFIRWRSQYSEF